MPMRIIGTSHPNQRPDPVVEHYWIKLYPGLIATPFTLAELALLEVRRQQGGAGDIDVDGMIGATDVAAELISERRMHAPKIFNPFDDSKEL